MIWPPDRLRKIVIQERLGLTKDRIQQRRLQYFEHVVRMDQGRHPKLSLEGYVHGKEAEEDQREDGWMG